MKRSTWVKWMMMLGVAGSVDPSAGGGVAQEVRDREGGAREPLLEGIGEWARKVSTDSEEAQRYFDQGLNLLFAFNHDEASRSFRQATELDPGCAMAWWGLAYAQGPHINRPVVEAEAAAIALEAIRKAREGSSLASGVERGLIEALAKRCVSNPPEDRASIDRAYAEAMQALRKNHPDDADVGAFAVESLMNLRPWDLYTQEGEPQPGTATIVEQLERLLKQAPDHPLANHLYIHAVEASKDPGRGLEAANRLRGLQPGLSHNVHMPSHIDVRLGHWKEAEESNQKAIEADRKFLSKRRDPGFYGLYIAHNYHMLSYAAMMRGTSKTAINAVDEMKERMPADWARKHAAIADGYLIMPLEVRLRFGRWEEVLEAPEPESSFPLARSLWRYARAVAFAAQGQVEEAETERAAFEVERLRVPEGWVFGNNKAEDLLAIAERFMAGEIWFRAGRQEEGIGELSVAAELQDCLRYSEPPDWILPVRHALGAALLQANRVEEAEKVYRDDLERQPENGWSLFGLARCLELQGKEEEHRKVIGRWREVWKDADVSLSSSCFCLPGLQ